MMYKYRSAEKCKKAIASFLRRKFKYAGEYPFNIYKGKIPVDSLNLMDDEICIDCVDAIDDSGEWFVLTNRNIHYFDAKKVHIIDIRTITKIKRVRPMPPIKPTFKNWYKKLEIYTNTSKEKDNVILPVSFDRRHEILSIMSATIRVCLTQISNEQ